MALDAVKPHGTVMLMGIATSPVTLNFFDKVQLKQLTLKGTITVSRQWDKAHDYTVVASLIEGGKLETDSLISHEFSIDDFEKGFNISDDSPKSIKVVFKLN